MSPKNKIESEFSRTVVRVNLCYPFTFGLLKNKLGE